MQNDTLIHNIWFRIEVGYNGGYMASEQHDRFYTEIRGLVYHGTPDRSGCYTMNRDDLWQTHT